jgi:hypothetical protein
MKKRRFKALAICCIAMLSPSAFSGEIENVVACIKAAQDYAGVELSESDARYSGNFVSFSVVRWDSVSCEVKLEYVHQMRIDDVLVIDQGFAGKKSYETNEVLSAKTEATVKDLEYKIAILEKRMEYTTQALQRPDPDHEQLSAYVEEGITKLSSGEKPKGLEKKPGK